MVCKELLPFLDRLFNQDEVLNTIIQKELNEQENFYINTTEYWKKLKKEDFIIGRKWKVEV